MTTDPIADMLTRIRNAQMASLPIVEIPFSKLKYKLAKILEREKFIERVIRKKVKNVKNIKIFLKYIDKKPAILKLKRVSKPGRRFYYSYKEIKSVKKGYGIAVISSSKGLITDKKARQQKIGGEILCEIW